MSALDTTRSIRYNTHMTNFNSRNDRYDDSPFVDDEDLVMELIAEGYSEEEARRMVGDYDPEDYFYGDDGLDRDVPDFVDDGDFE